MTLTIPHTSGHLQHQVITGGLLLALLVVVTQATFLPYGFSFIDSPTILVHGIMYSPYEYFSSPYHYEFLSPDNLTPWVTLSWEIDYALSGLDPLGFRIHQLAAATLLVVLIFTVLIQLKVQPIVAFLFSWAMSVTPAFLDVTAALESRHYLEGLIFSLTSTLCILQYNKDKQYFWLIVSALLYALATTAKEIYVPLPGILFFLLQPGLQARALSILPHAIVTIGYMFWRFHMLRGSFGGYSEAGAYSSVIASGEQLAAAPGKVVDYLFGTKTQSLIALGAYVTVAACSYRKLSANMLIAAVVAGFWLLAPLFTLLPVLSLGYFSGRWLFLPLTVLLIFFAYLCSVAPAPARIITLSLLLVWTVGATYKQLADHEPPITTRGQLSSHILAANNSLYIDTQGPLNIFVAPNIPLWIYLSKLHHGQWGTMTLTFPAHIYHDNREKIRVDERLEKLSPAPPFIPRKDLRLNTIEKITYDPTEEALTFSLSNFNGKGRCTAYFFGEENGMPSLLGSCQQWTISIVRMALVLRQLGYAPEQANIAVWQNKNDRFIVSRPYNLFKLLAANNIDTRDIFDD